MVEIYDAHEQGEVVKKWLQENGAAIVIGIVVAFGGLFGFKQWQSWQASKQQEAYAEFNVMSELLSASQLDAAMDNFQNLQDQHADSPYASLAALQMGRARVEASQPDLAINQYRFVMDEGRPTALKTVARLRLARLLLAQDKAEEALSLIENAPETEGFVAGFAEVRGDILKTLGRSEDAVTAYQEALDSLEPGVGDRATLVLKLEALGVVPDEEGAA
ncbi:YfgM family protein [Elongatibacter sediminis]|uniref:Ancillary SecYEG translocon subunit n=1 Tax=Elongatibacter sediminis TaxID=3119006 RepID=A0AAW9RE27_9GAMM